MDKIYLNQLAFYGYHGVFEEERRLGQRYLVDLVLEADLRKACETDSIQYSIDYGKVYHITQTVVEGRASRLIESVADRIIHELFLHFSALHGCKVTVYKPNPPIAGHYQSAAVELYRENHK
ncbi:dihydroneopterin aldolase [Gracilibacillus halophilus YIM-C55.5]|uniref:7,8-dihydroneopterin aldolase n=1 Tax=Gracilibacillus halophilus YIM-C55.5 TaxID=1308866 RepID=N4WX55_9BACI|nr:dihydroneopterin aldolase [Gracilibacillus halophilus]ENH97646.1 dihydroneopterin aldolase [Gracilibacillus halophilus YIM-C55.5]